VRPFYARCPESREGLSERMAELLFTVPEDTPVGLPLVFGAILLAKNRDPFAASVMLWWSAVEVMDVAILGDLGLLRHAQGIGYAVHHLGALLMGAALAWGGYVLWRQWHAGKL
jgi:hypothetical protein